MVELPVLTGLQYSAIIYAFILFHHSCDRPLTDYPDEENLTSGNSNGYNYREFRRPADSFKGKAFRQIQKTCVDLLKAVEIYQKKIFCKLTKWQWL